MSKYIIDLRPDCKVVQQICAIDKGINIGSRSIGLLDELTDDYVKKNFKDLLEGEYQRGFEDGKKEAESSEAIERAKADAFNKGMLFKEKKINDAFKRGFEKGKAVNDKGCEGCLYNDGTKEHSPCDICCNAYLNRWTAKPQEDDKIEVGDEVKSLSDSGVEIEGLLPWVVTTVDQGDYCQGIDSKGEVHATKKVRACKTGRHFDIEKILEAMKHD